MRLEEIGMSQLNREWHRNNRMPEHASLDDRIAWHVGHVQNCSCREMPPRIAGEIVKRGLKLPTAAGKR
jgi:hypothetical protein